MGNLTEGERRALFWVLVAVLVWTLGKWFWLVGMV